MSKNPENKWVYVEFQPTDLSANTAGLYKVDSNINYPSIRTWNSMILDPMQALVQ